jgi:hypothetical protein
MSMVTWEHCGPCWRKSWLLEKLTTQRNISSGRESQSKWRDLYQPGICKFFQAPPKEEDSAGTRKNRPAYSAINDLHKSLYVRSPIFQSPFLFTAYLDNDAPTLNAMPLLTLFSRLGDSARRPPGNCGNCTWVCSSGGMSAVWTRCRSLLIIIRNILALHL